jgi:hypothetical protein
MDSGMIGKIQKAKRYAQELDRITFNEFQVTFRGNHDTYKITYDEGQWSCGCNFFAKRGICSHTMALERVMGVMLAPAEEAEPRAAEA